MGTNKKEERNIVEEINDKKKVVFLPCLGVEIQSKDKNIIFRFGDDIRKYKSFDYEYKSKTIEPNGECYDSDRYNFIKIPIIAWTDEETGDKYINLIGCDITCIWKDKELIGMPYEEFAKEFQLIPDSFDKQWSPGPYKNDRNYEVYTFDNLGLMLWVWRKRIRQILISAPDVNY